MGFVAVCPPCRWLTMRDDVMALPDACPKCGRRLLDIEAAKSAAAFGRWSDDVRPDEFYAGWADYDQALLGMTHFQQSLQQRAEVIELERLARL